MANLLQELQNNEAVLLMYLSGELADEDRAEVEQMLAGDASLRAELEEVGQLQAASNAALARLDAISRLPVKQDAALRQVNRLLNRWGVERLTKVRVPEPTKSLPLPWWSYPFAAAAAVMLAFLVYWGNKEEPIGARWGSDYVAQAPVEPIGTPDTQQALDSAAAFDLADQLVQSFDQSDLLLDDADSTVSLADAEAQLFALATASDEVFSLNVSDVNQ